MTLAGGAWEVATPEQVGDFTAVGYFFARALREHVDVPIGLINTSWGGSRIEAWMSAATLGLDVSAMEDAPGGSADCEQADPRPRRGPDRRPAGAGPRASSTGTPVGRPRPRRPRLARVPVPSLVGGRRLRQGMDGVGWYRTTIDLTAEEAAGGALLGLGMIDDSDIDLGQRPPGRPDGEGVEPARGSTRCRRRPSARDNTIAVRVEDYRRWWWRRRRPRTALSRGGRRAAPCSKAIWRFRPGLIQLNLEDRNRKVPTRLYNKMVHPLLPYPIKGILWYQGESNTGPGDAYAYRDLFAAMIEDWRPTGGPGTYPFLFVQLASFLPPSTEPAESDWALLRESQSAALALPGTAQVVLIDAGEAADVHPRNKQVVGERLALAARQDRLRRGDRLFRARLPRARGHGQSRRHRLRPRRRRAGCQGCARWRPGRLRHRRVRPALRLGRGRYRQRPGRGAERSRTGARRGPLRLGDNPEGANLYNREGLPAAPFRTDDWRVEVPREPPLESPSDNDESRLR